MKLILSIFLLAAPLLSQTLINGSRVIAGTMNYCADAGSTDAYACSLSPAITAYATGGRYTFKANTANTGAATLALNGLTATAIVKYVGGVAQALADNDIRAAAVVEVVYDGTNFQIVSVLGNGGGGGSSVLAAGGVYFPFGVSAEGSLNPAPIIAGGAVSHAFVLSATIDIGRIAIYVNTAQPSTCNGGAGACGFVIAIYDSSRSSKLCQTTFYGGLSGGDITSIGAKSATWVSGPNVSGGVCSLSAGTYFLMHASEGTALRPAANSGNTLMAVVKAAGGTGSNAYWAGYASVTSATGTGSAYSLPTNMSAATFTALANSTYWPYYVFGR
jgi:hypothetical protein